MSVLGWDVCPECDRWLGGDEDNLCERCQEIWELEVNVKGNENE